MAYRPLNLLEEVHLLLANATETRKEIAKASGVGIDWLNKLAQGKARNPRYRQLDQVYRYLKYAEKSEDSGTEE